MKTSALPHCILFAVVTAVSCRTGLIRVSELCEVKVSEPHAAAYFISADWSTTLHFGAFDVCRIAVNRPALAQSANIQLGQWNDEACRMGLQVVESNGVADKLVYERRVQAKCQSDENKSKSGGEHWRLALDSNSKSAQLVLQLTVGKEVSWSKQAEESKFGFEVTVTFESEQWKVGQTSEVEGQCVSCNESTEVTTDDDVDVQGGKNKCIDKSLVCDGYVNCYESQLDEMNCAVNSGKNQRIRTIIDNYQIDPRTGASLFYDRSAFKPNGVFGSDSKKSLVVAVSQNSDTISRNSSAATLRMEEKKSSESGFKRVSRLKRQTSWSSWSDIRQDFDSAVNTQRTIAIIAFSVIGGIIVIVIGVICSRVCLQRCRLAHSTTMATTTTYCAPANTLPMQYSMGTQSYLPPAAAVYNYSAVPAVAPGYPGYPAPGTVPSAPVTYSSALPPQFGAPPTNFASQPVGLPPANFAAPKTGAPAIGVPQPTGFTPTSAPAPTYSGSPSGGVDYSRTTSDVPLPTTSAGSSSLLDYQPLSSGYIPSVNLSSPYTSGYSSSFDPKPNSSSDTNK